MAAALLCPQDINIVIIQKESRQGINCRTGFIFFIEEECTGRKRISQAEQSYVFSIVFQLAN
jgi:hypothetical protein